MSTLTDLPETTSAGLNAASADHEKVSGSGAIIYYASTITPVTLNDSLAELKANPLNIDLQFSVPTDKIT